MSELLACPFCGSTKIESSADEPSGKNGHVWCASDDYRHEVNVYAPTLNEAIKQWNNRATGKVLLTKEQEPRTRTLLRSMLAAFDRGDSDTYWVTFGMLLEVHKEVMSADTKGTR